MGKIRKKGKDSGKGKKDSEDLYIEGFYFVEDGIFNMAEEELKRFTKDSLLKKLTKDGIIELLFYYEISASTRETLMKLRRKAASLPKEDIIYFIANYDDIDVNVDMFDMSEDELMSFKKEDLIKELIKDDIIYLLHYYNKRAKTNERVSELRRKAENLSKEEIVNFIANYGEINWEGFEWEDLGFSEDGEDDESEEEDDYGYYEDEDFDTDEGSNSYEKNFFSLLEGFYFPKEFIVSVKEKRITFDEFKRDLKKRITSMHPDKGYNSEMEKEIKNEILIKYNKNKDFIMKFAEEYLKGN